MNNKSVVNEARDIQIAIELINLGARLQIVHEETELSRDRLLKLYKEIKGESPSKGLLPYSTGWFLYGLPNIHSSLFMDCYQYMIENSSVTGVEALIKSYRLYLEKIDISQSQPELNITRAWLLIRFLNAKMLELTSCTECGAQFVTHTDELTKNHICGNCSIHSRARKAKKSEFMT